MHASMEAMKNGRYFFVRLTHIKHGAMNGFLTWVTSNDLGAGGGFDHFGLWSGEEG